MPARVYADDVETLVLYLDIVYRGHTMSPEEFWEINMELPDGSWDTICHPTRRELGEFIRKWRDMKGDGR
jgi:hypothetical protein